MIDNGYILIARSIMYSEIWKKKPEYLKVWIYLLMHVNHKKNKVFPRGSNFFNVPEISKETGVGVNTVYNSIEWLKKARQITTQKTTRGIVVNVLQYDKYQDPVSYKGETDYDTKGEISTKQVRNGYDTINNNEKNERMKEIECGEKEKKIEPDKAKTGNEKKVATATHPMDTFYHMKETKHPGYFQFADKVAGSHQVPREKVLQEFEKFFNYWKQKNPSDKKELWQMQKVFDVKRRITTWMSNLKETQKQPKKQLQFYKSTGNI